MHTFYEFFAGGGMVRAGLGAAWQCLMANDLCPKKTAAYTANWGDTQLIVRDVHAVTTAELPGYADLAWGSFPCQDLSLAGMGAGLDGTHSGAFWGFWNLMRSLAREQRKPKIIVLENVVGALTSHGGKDFASIAHALTGEGYRFGAMVQPASRCSRHEHS
jgi:DNA (cytosine-5)-methyltransferase 1